MTREREEKERWRMTGGGGTGLSVFGQMGVGELRKLALFFLSSRKERSLKAAVCKQGG